MKLVFDLEANGLLYEATKIHCICAKDIETRERYKFSPVSIPEGLELLGKADILIGHNICGFDLPLILKLYPEFRFKGARDTLCMSKLFDPERLSHGLESYGKQFGRPKPEHHDWFAYTCRMLHRCFEDVEINHLTYKHLIDKYCKNWKWLRSLDIEQEFAYYRAFQELEGVDIDVDTAHLVLDKLDAEISELDTILLDLIPKKVIMVGKEDGYLPFKKNGEYNEATKRWMNPL